MVFYLADGGRLRVRSPARVRCGRRADGVGRFGDDGLGQAAIQLANEGVSAVGPAFRELSDRSPSQMCSFSRCRRGRAIGRPTTDAEGGSFVFAGTRKLRTIGFSGSSAGARDGFVFPMSVERRRVCAGNTERADAETIACGDVGMRRLMCRLRMLRRCGFAAIAWCRSAI